MKPPPENKEFQTPKAPLCGDQRPLDLRSLCPHEDLPGSHKTFTEHRNKGTTQPHGHLFFRLAKAQESRPIGQVPTVSQSAQGVATASLLGRSSADGLNPSSATLASFVLTTNDASRTKAFASVCETLWTKETKTNVYKDPPPSSFFFAPFLSPSNSSSLPLSTLTQTQQTHPTQPPK